MPESENYNFALEKAEMVEEIESLRLELMARCEMIQALSAELRELKEEKALASRSEEEVLPPLEPAPFNIEDKGSTQPANLLKKFDRFLVNLGNAKYFSTATIGSFAGSGGVPGIIENPEKFVMYLGFSLAFSGTMTKITEWLYNQTNPKGFKHGKK